MNRRWKVVLVVVAVLTLGGVVWSGGGWLIHNVRIMHGGH